MDFNQLWSNFNGIYQDMEDNFDRVRCYTDGETVEALKRMVEYDEFFPLFKHVFPNLDQSALKELFLSIVGSFDFQKRIVDRAVKTIIKHSMDDFSSCGIENLEPDKAYLFVANHRDIVLDAALLQHVMISNNRNTTQITFGNNLMISPFIIDFGKSNKMFTVFRDSDRREQLKNSQELSEYMRSVIKNRNESIWIAQRSGRTKDGIDATQQGLLRMFSMSGKGNIKERLKELNIVPLTISYEYEPCDYLKVYETCHSKKGKYVKKTGEDFISITHGIAGYKGQTKLVIGQPLNQFIDSMPDTINKTELLQLVALEVDRQIYTNYQLWPTNYIAHDLLTGDGEYASKYNPVLKEKFVQHMNSVGSKLDLEKCEFEQVFLDLYANPIRTLGKLGSN